MVVNCRSAIGYLARVGKAHVLIDICHVSFPPRAGPPPFPRRLVLFILFRPLLSYCPLSHLTFCFSTYSSNPHLLSVVLPGLLPLLVLLLISGSWSVFLVESFVFLCLQGLIFAVL